MTRRVDLAPGRPDVLRAISGNIGRKEQIEIGEPEALRSARGGRGLRASVEIHCRFGIKGDCTRGRPHRARAR